MWSISHSPALRVSLTMLLISAVVSGACGGRHGGNPAPILLSASDWVVLEIENHHDTAVRVHWIEPHISRTLGTVPRHDQKTLRIRRDWTINRPAKIALEPRGSSFLTLVDVSWGIEGGETLQLTIPYDLRFRPALHMRRSP